MAEVVGQEPRQREGRGAAVGGVKVASLLLASLLEDNINHLVDLQGFI